MLPTIGSVIHAILYKAIVDIGRLSGRLARHIDRHCLHVQLALWRAQPDRTIASAMLLINLSSSLAPHTQLYIRLDNCKHIIQNRPEPKEIIILFHVTETNKYTRYINQIRLYILVSVQQISPLASVSGELKKIKIRKAISDVPLHTIDT